MKILFLILGLFFLALGIAGIYLPLLPATPFLLLATFFFSKSSKKFNDYFISTNIYKDFIEPIKSKRAITKEKKFKILAMVTVFIGISFYFVNNLHARICLAFVLIFHYIYFLFKVKTVVY